MSAFDGACRVPMRLLLHLESMQKSSVTFRLLFAVTNHPLLLNKERENIYMNCRSLLYAWRAKAPIYRGYIFDMAKEHKREKKATV